MTSIAREPAAPPPLAVHRRHRRGRHRGLDARPHAGSIADAEIVFGGKRHLGLAAPLIRGAARPWPSPFDARRRGGAGRSRPPGLRARLGRSVPLRRRRDPRAARRPARNARGAGAVGFQPRRGAPRLGAAGDDARSRSHGRALDLIRPHLHPGARILALTSDGEGPAALARLLADIGFGASRTDRARSARRPRERVRATTRRQLRPRRRRRAQHRRHRGRGRRRTRA